MVIYIESRICEELKIPYNEKTEDKEGQAIPRQTYEISKEDLIFEWESFARDIYHISTVEKGRLLFEDWHPLYNDTIKLINKGHGYFEAT